jgi:hypothetical protein
MRRDGNSRVSPPALSNKHIKRIKRTLPYTSGEFVYKDGRKETVRISCSEERIDETARIIVCKDADENNSRR